MVNICSIKSCRNIGKDGVHMHKFPSNEQIAVIWTNTIKKIQPSYMPLKTSMICSAHFQSSDYNLNCKKIRLNDNAVPSIFLTTSRMSLMKIFEDLPKDINIDILKNLQYDGHKINITTKVEDSILNTSECSEASTCLNYNLSTCDNTKVNETISNTAECSEASTSLKYNLSTSDNTKVNETISNTAECSEASTSLKYNQSTSDNTEVNKTISNTAECSEASTSLKYNLSTSDTFSVIGVADNMLTRRPLVTRKKRKTYVGDFNENDLDNPRKRKKYWNISQRTFNKYKHRVKRLQNQNRYLRKKIKNHKCRAVNFTFTEN